MAKNNSCSQCSICLDGPVLHVAEGKLVCTSCFDLYEVICGNPYFLKAQSDWEALEMQKRQRFNQLKPGGNYFI